MMMMTFILVSSHLLIQLSEKLEMEKALSYMKIRNYQQQSNKVFLQQKHQSHENEINKCGQMRLSLNDSLSVRSTQTLLIPFQNPL